MPLDIETFYTALKVAMLAGAVIVLFMVLLAPRVRRTAFSWGRLLAKTILILLGLVVALVIIAMLFGPFLLVGLLASGLMLRFCFVNRDSIATLVFSTLTASTRQNLPLATALEMEASRHSGKRMLILNGIADWLMQGFPLSESLSRGYPGCPGYALGTVSAGERVGQIPQALAIVQAELARRNRESRRIQPVNPAYPAIVILVLVTILSFTMVFILPSFQKLFSEMQAELPVSTRILMSLSREYGGLAGSVLLVATLAAIVVGLYTRLRPRRPQNPHLLSRLGDSIKWRLPFVRWFEWNISLARTVSFLRISLGAGCPVDQAIDSVCDLDLNENYRRRLRRWGEQVRSGQEVSAAARRCRVGASLAWALDADVNPGNAPAVLEMLESSYRSRYNYAANMARFILWPCVTLGLALTVGFVVFSLFMPMITMIDQACKTTLP